MNIYRKKVLFILIVSAFTFTLKAQNILPQDDKIYTGNIDVMPEFKGGMDKFYARLGEIHYTIYDRMTKHQGRVTVMMIIEKDGSLSNLKVVHGFSDKEDSEILRVLRSLRKWKPGMQNGKPVRVLCSVPINFELINPS